MVRGSVPTSSSASAMALAIIAGILFATFLTLVLVPVMYSVLDDATELFRTHFTYLDEDEASVEADVGDAESGVSEGGRSYAPSPARPEPETVGARRAIGQTPLLDPQPEGG